MLQFRWLWVGVPSYKHGWGVIGEIWNICFSGREDVQLWVKALDPRHFGIEQYNNITFDFRRLPPDQVRGLYYSSDACVLPSTGHDWQGPLKKAILTGMPCVVLSGEIVRGYDYIRFPAWEIGISNGDLTVKRVDAIRSMLSITERPRTRVAVSNKSDLAKSTEKIMKLLATS